MLEQKSSLKKGIQSMIRMTAIIAFGAYQERKKVKFVEKVAGDSLYMKLIRKIDEGELLYVEEFLLENIEKTNSENFRLALYVLGYMNEKSDDFLEKHDFKRSWIEKDVRDVVEKYGYSFIL